MRGGLAQSGYAATGRCNCPDVGGRHLVIAPGKKPNVRVCQRDPAEHESIVSATVKIQKRDRAEQPLLPAKRQDAFGIERQVFSQGRLCYLNSRNHAMGHIRQGRKFEGPRRAHLDRRIGR